MSTKESVFEIECKSFEDRSTVSKGLRNRYGYKEIEGEGGHAGFTHFFVKDLATFYSHVESVKGEVVLISMCQKISF